MAEILRTEAEVIEALATRVMGYVYTANLGEAGGGWWKDRAGNIVAEPGQALTYQWDPLCGIADAHELLSRFNSSDWHREGDIHTVTVWKDGLFHRAMQQPSFCLAACRAALSSVEIEYRT